MTLQYRHNTRTLSEKIKFISTRNRKKKSLYFLLLKLVQINCIFADNVRIVFIKYRRLGITLKVLLQTKSVVDM